MLRQIYDNMADPSGDVSMRMRRHLFLFFLQVFSREREAVMLVHRQRAAVTMPLTPRPGGPALAAS